MRIQTNIDALNAYRNLGNTNRSLSKSLERLSSGFRINRAADDAAGLAISEKMRGQIRGLNQAARNAQDGISLIQTAEGSLNETHAILQRMRELSVQAANDTLTASDRMEIQKEVDQLRTEIDRIANTTEFNTKKLLDGTTSALVSTDKLETKVFMRDGLRVEDQFGQKAVGGGNFRLDIVANPGTGQVQKTDIFKVKHGEDVNVLQDDHVGYARFEGEVGFGAGGDTFTLEFRVDGERFTVTGNADTDAATTAEGVAQAINLTTGLNDTIKAVAVGDNLRIERHDQPTENFSLWGDVSGGSSLAGLEAMEDHLAVYNPGTQNITSLGAVDPERFIAGDYYIETDNAYDTVAVAAATVIDNAADGSEATLYIDNAVGGTFDLTFNTDGIDETTLTFSHDATAQDIAAALNDLGATDTVTVASGAGTESDPWVFQLEEGGADFTAFAVDTANLAGYGDANVFTTQFSSNGNDLIQLANVDMAAEDSNLSLSMEVTDVNTTDNEITVSYAYYNMEKDGIVTAGSGVRNLSATGLGGDNDGEIFGGVTFTTFDFADTSDFSVGDKMVFNVVAHSGAATDESLYITRDGTDLSDRVAHFAVNEGVFSDADPNFNFFQLDEATGNMVDSRLDISINGNIRSTVNGLGDEISAGGFTIAIQDGIGHVASADTSIYDIDRFWDASGNFLVEDPQTITLVQGDGTKAAFTIFRDDTIADVVQKIDAAIRNEKTNFTPGTIEAGKGLGQGALAPSDAQFAYYVDDPELVPDLGQTFDTVEGTILINSAIAGNFGEIKFIGDEEVIKALSLTTVREAQENRFTIDVVDAHTGDAVARDMTITSNLLVGVVHTNVDVEFDPNANVDVNWSAGGEGQVPRGFTFEAGENPYQTFVHLADNTMVYHIGANPLQDVAAAIGDMTTRSLGVHNTLVMDRASANESIAKIDNAIERVSAERSKLGALQNRLEHTISNLAVASENLSAAESRIRDVDMASEMMEFTKNQILAQAGTAMLAQANMKPQMVLQLLG